MRRFYLLIIVCVMDVLQVCGQGQPARDSLGKDTLHKDSTHIVENLLLQQQKQGQVDSALRNQLEAELQMAKGNQAKTRELQSELQRLLNSDSTKRSQQLQRIRTLKRKTSGYPVVLNDDTLFLLYTKTGSFSAADRADAISKRINKLYKNYSFVPDSLKLLSTESGFDLVYKEDFTIMSVAQLDALWFDMSTDSLGIFYRSVIIREIVKEKKANSFNNWIRRIGWAALIILLLTLVVFGIRKLFRLTADFIRRNKEKFAHGLTFRKYRLVTPEKLEQFALRICSGLRIFLILLTVYIALLLISGLFTATEKWTGTLLSWILTPARSFLRSLIHFLPNLVTILVVYFIFRFIIKGVKYISGEIGKGNMVITGFHRDWARPTFNIVKFILYAFMLVLIFPYLPGSASPAFRGVTVFLGLLISLGSSSAINNIVAGLVITYMRPFKIGDRVRIGDVTGDVLEKNMLVTRIRTIKNEDVTVPNSAVLSASSINYSSNTQPGDKGLILHTTVTIGYDTPWKKMHEALIEAARRTDLLEKAPEPFVLQTSLDDFYVSYQLNVYTKEANKQATIYSQLHQNIQDACNEAGIEIMSPHYNAMRDGNASTIPPDYLPKDYEAPPFFFRQRGMGNHK